ncbi:hypothetical protein [Gracilibacillus alcaliphilus]|uniref:hypothetical protein n=1 Tax=Gracilibacillus alcaliphilus TaxID=1401441 RepID=UPI00195DA088|nr:hypothetical protein [Gracilibacillus alcaliphilus]MBM7677542.1 hypothetical protein [Gracilibacillus alcaliphilus]
MQLLDMPVSLTERLAFPVDLPESGYYSIMLTVNSSTSWLEEGNEASMVRLYMDELHQQDIVLFYGQVSFHYERYLGEWCSGSYQLHIEPFTDQSEIIIEAIHIKKVTPAANDLLALQHAPILFGRAIYGDYDNLYTDTPLEMLYRIDEWEQGKVIEYHMVFSHEDEGTPAMMLMAKWGRLLDIEYMIRIYLKADHSIDHAIFQGANHIETTYSKTFIDGKRPVMQTATGNGNFTDEITSRYHFSFLPKEWKAEEEPREFVMERFPYVNHVMEWEAKRQLTEKQPAYNQLATLSSFLFIQSSIWDVELGQVTVDFACQLEGDDHWYSSSYDQMKLGSFTAAYTGPDHYFAVAIFLPIEFTFPQIKRIKVRLINQAVEQVTVKGLKVFTYHKEQGLQACLRQTENYSLNQHQTEHIMWHR